MNFAAVRLIVCKDSIIYLYPTLRPSMKFRPEGERRTNVTRYIAIRVTNKSGIPYPAKRAKKGCFFVVIDSTSCFAARRSYIEGWLGGVVNNPHIKKPPLREVSFVLSPCGITDALPGEPGQSNDLVV